MLFVEEGQHVDKDTVIAKWDPFNAVIVTENAGKVQFENVTEGISLPCWEKMKQQVCVSVS